MASSNLLNSNETVSTTLSSALRHNELEHFAEIGRLSASLLHEISTPLTAAMLWLDLPHEQIHHHPHVQRARHSMKLLQRYVEATRQQIRRESCCRNFLIQKELAEVLRVLTPLAARRQVALHVTSDIAFTLYGDPVKFQQIIANSITNAIDAHQNTIDQLNKQVTVDWRAKKNSVDISVRDTGCGMTALQLSKIFEPFYTTKQEQSRGLGIGLYTTKRYVEQDFHGSIQALSTPSKGTTVTVRLRHNQNIT